MDEFDPVNYITKLIKHGISHMEENTNFDLHIAMISIDNSVELCFRTYLDIDGYVRFPKLIIIFQRRAPPKIKRETQEIIKEAREIHKKRNGAYHSIRKKPIKYDTVCTYASIAKVLLTKLFNRHIEKLFVNLGKKPKLIEEFYENWSKIYEKLIIFYFDITDIIDPYVDEFRESIELMSSSYYRMIENKDYILLNQIRSFKEELISSEEIISTDTLEEHLLYLKDLYPRLEDKISEYYEYENLYKAK